MRTVKKPEARVEAFADHQVITPAKTLRHTAHKLAGEAGDFALDPEAVARAEAALEQLSGEFDDWMKIECDRLEAARKALEKGGLSVGSLDVLFRAAHDIKGEGTTFGYPFATEIAASLCRLVLHTPAPRELPIELVDRHVAAIRAVVREEVRSEDDATALELLDRLRAMTDTFLLEQHKDDPAWLAEHASPPLADVDAETDADAA